MARWAKSDKARIELRRAKVQEMSARGLGLYEITKELADLKILNPETGEAYSVATISRDLSELEQRWREKAMADRDEAKAEQLGELRTVRRAAWAKGDYPEVRRNLQAEMELLGTRAPERQEISGPDGKPIEHREVGLDAKERNRALASLADAITDSLHRRGGGGSGTVGTTEQDPMAGAPDSG